jgi:amino acid transporter
MKKNMGTMDRLLRILAAVVIGVLYLTGSIGGLAAIVLGVVALAFVVTSVVGFCPAYVPLRMSTRKQPSASAHV